MIANRAQLALLSLSDLSLLSQMTTDAIQVMSEPTPHTRTLLTINAELMSRLSHQSKVLAELAVIVDETTAIETLELSKRRVVTRLEMGEF